MLDGMIKLGSYLNGFYYGYWFTRPQAAGVGKVRAT